MASKYYISKITYKRGQCNCDADLLSRFPYDDNEHPHRVRCFTSMLAQSIQLNVFTRSKSKALQQSSSPASPLTTVPSSPDNSVVHHRSIINP
jgi:hypothetical protein